MIDFLDANNNQPSLINVCIVDKKRGRVVYSSDKKCSLNDLKEKNFNKFGMLKSIPILNKTYQFYAFVYKNDMKKYLKDTLLTSLRKIKFEDSGYLFIVDNDGKVLLSANKIMDKYLEEVSPKNGAIVRKKFFDIAKKEGKGFVEYNWFKPDLKTESRKVSYIVYDKKLKWIVGAGVYFDDINKDFIPLYFRYKRKLYKEFWEVFFIWLLSVLFQIWLVFLLLGEKFNNDLRIINSIFEKFYNSGISEIENFQCNSLSFKETCEFAGKVKNNLLALKKSEEKLLSTNEELKATTEMLEKITKNVNNGIIVSDEYFNFEFINPAAEKILGIEKENLSINFLEVLSKEDKKMFLNLITSKAGNFKKEITVKNNLKRIEVYISPLKFKNKNGYLLTLIDITERYKLLKELSVLNERYRKAEEMALVGNWVYYPDKRQFWATEMAHRIYGIEKRQNRFVNIEEIEKKIYKQDVYEARKTVLIPIKNREAYEAYFRVVTGDVDTLRYVVSKGNPVVGENGKVERVEGVIKDITDLKKVEIELNKQIDILEKTQKFAQIGYWEYDFAKKEFNLVSSFFTKVLSRDKVDLNDFLRDVYIEDREFVKSVIEKEFLKDEKLIYTFRFVHPQLKLLRYIFVESYLSRDELGNIKRVGFIQDITRLKELEKKVEIERERLIETLDRLSEGVAITDENFNVVFANKSLINIFAEEDLDKKNILDFLKKSSIKDLPENISTEKITDIFNGERKFYYKPYNSEIILTIEAEKLFDEEKLSGYLFVVNDITHSEKYMDEVVKNQNMRLLNKIAASLAHDFNNLLGSILGKISILEKQFEGQDIEKELKKIMRNMKIAKALATQFLTFSKTGKPLFSNLSKGFLKQTIDDLANFVFSGSSIKVNKNIEDNLWAIKGDPTQIAQVILNLFSNARDVLNEKGVVNVEVKNVIAEGKPDNCNKGEYVLIKVEDNGPGIPKEKLDKIFQFFVGYKDQGFGLGLAIVRNIVKAHGGCIEVKSEVGKGTAFYVYFPANRDFVVNGQEETKPAQEEVREGEDLDLGKIKIAVLEDEEPMQETIYDLMDFLGLNGQIFAKGEDLVEGLKKELKKGKPYNVAILDLTVKGGKGGKEIINEIKSIYPEIKAIVSSGFSKGVVFAEYEKYGFDEVLSKPYTVEEFKKAIIKCMKK
ncbi:two-component system sensor kinase and response regulator [Thermotomaculum hydrothermale]|uniref:histidine kinase n=1 Tax=Thermotomaculum hydrothermale TaxID=981385 RepID=A0A7R6PYP5_9BACT|nr:two-component system sensor kinase and response regulator [Thermotomaculum hydrothermale]